MEIVPASRIAPDGTIRPAGSKYDKGTKENPFDSAHYMSFTAILDFQGTKVPAKNIPRHFRWRAWVDGQMPRNHFGTDVHTVSFGLSEPVTSMKQIKVELESNGQKVTRMFWIAPPEHFSEPDEDPGPIPAPTTPEEPEDLPDLDNPVTKSRMQRLMEIEKLLDAALVRVRQEITSEIPN